MRTRTIATILVAGVLGAGFGPVAASQAASATRASRSVAGVRFTLDEWARYLLSNQAKQACAMLTTAGQAAWAKDNNSKNCLVASKADYTFLKANPSDAKLIKDYGNTQPVVVHGDTATVPKLTGGDRTLVYRNGLWFINS